MSKYNIPNLLFKVFLIGSVFLANFGLASSTESGFDIFNRMKKTYAELKVYNDTGLVEEKYIRNGIAGNFTKTLEFRTSYIHSGEFSFEWKKTRKKININENIIRIRNGEIYEVFDGNKIVYKNINKALGTIAGTSKGTSYLVTPYLFKEMYGLDLSKVKKINVDVYKNANRYKYELKVNFKDGGSNIYWLNDKYLITKYSSILYLKDGVNLVRETTVFPK